MKQTDRSYWSKSPFPSQQLFIYTYLEQPYENPFWNFSVCISHPHWLDIDKVQKSLDDNLRIMKNIDWNYWLKSPCLSEQLFIYTYY